MRLILSRKGFDSTYGKNPSPIFPDGRMISLPIKDPRSQIRYADINCGEYNVGSLVSDLTRGEIPASERAHLDPDLRRDSIPRLPMWRPIFGQTGAPQGHLRNQGVGPGDIFLFFGLFQRVKHKLEKFEWDKSSPKLHVLWGWLQIDEILVVDACDKARYKWASYHPHFNWTPDEKNTVYVSRQYLKLPGVGAEEFAGAGVFKYFSEQIQLTAPHAKSHTIWDLPEWFYPRDGKSRLIPFPV